MNEDMDIRSLYDLIFINYDKIPSSCDISKRVVKCILASYFKIGCSEKITWFFHSLSNLHIHTFFKEENLLEIRSLIHNHKINQSTIMDLLFMLPIELQLEGFSVSEVIEYYVKPLSYIINDKSNVIDIKLLSNLNDSKLIYGVNFNKNQNTFIDKYALLLIFIIRVEITNVLLIINKYNVH